VDRYNNGLQINTFNLKTIFNSFQKNYLNPLFLRALKTNTRYELRLVAFFRCLCAFPFGDRIPLDLPKQDGEQKQAR
jgi:hypothetical protein